MKTRGRQAQRPSPGREQEPKPRVASILARKARRRLCSYCGRKERENREGKKLVEVKVPAPEGEDRGGFLVHEACRDEIDRRAEESLEERQRKENIETSVMFAAAQAKTKEEEDRREPFEEKRGILVPKAGRAVAVPLRKAKKEGDS